MDNTYFILSKENLCIERFHICTWNLKDSSAFVEFGIEIKKDKLGAEFDVFLAVPFANYISKTYSLHENLANGDNCKLIFNDTMINQQPIEGDSHKGSIITFSQRDKLAIVSVSPENLDGEGLIKFHVKTPREDAAAVYFRVLVELGIKDIAIVHSGINKKTFIYDFKVNETRNLPENVYHFKEDQRLQFCEIQSVFLFHCVPDNYDISYIDSSKLRNVRRLETAAFNKYLKDIESIEKDRYIIVFLKSKGNENYSFFTTFVKEYIGNKQIIFAVLANIACSLLLSYDRLLALIPNDVKLCIAFIPWWGWCVVCVLLIPAYWDLKRNLL